MTIVALELLRRRVVDDTERRLAGDVLTALVAGDLAGAELARRLEPFGLRERAGVLVLAPPRGVARAPPRRRSRGRCARRPAAGSSRPPGRFLCALLPAAGDDELFALGRAPARARGARGRRAAAGRRRAASSRPATCGAASTRRAARWRRAALALNGARRRGAPRSPPTATSAPSSCCSRCRTTTRCGCSATRSSRPIEESEGAYGGELMRSLEAFIECNGQWERAAQALFCHRHTLRYRIRRVEELTGRSLDSARDRIDFWLALRGRELVP